MQLIKVTEMLLALLGICGTITSAYPVGPQGATGLLGGDNVTISYAQAALAMHKAGGLCQIEVLRKRDDTEAQMTVDDNRAASASESPATLEVQVTSTPAEATNTPAAPLLRFNDDVAWAFQPVDAAVVDKVNDILAGITNGLVTRDDNKGKAAGIIGGVLGTPFVGAGTFYSLRWLRTQTTTSAETYMAAQSALITPAAPFLDIPIPAYPIHWEMPQDLVSAAIERMNRRVAEEAQDFMQSVDSSTASQMLSAGSSGSSEINYDLVDETVLNHADVYEPLAELRAQLEAWLSANPYSAATPPSEFVHDTPSDTPQSSLDSSPGSEGAPAPDGDQSNSPGTSPSSGDSLEPAPTGPLEAAPTAAPEPVAEPPIVEAPAVEPVAAPAAPAPAPALAPASAPVVEPSVPLPVPSVPETSLFGDDDSKHHGGHHHHDHNNEHKDEHKEKHDDDHDDAEKKQKEKEEKAAKKQADEEKKQKEEEEKAAKKQADEEKKKAKEDAKKAKEEAKKAQEDAKEKAEEKKAKAAEDKKKADAKADAKKTKDANKKKHPSASFSPTKVGKKTYSFSLSGADFKSATLDGAESDGSDPTEFLEKKVGECGKLEDWKVVSKGGNKGQFEVSGQLKGDKKLDKKCLEKAIRAVGGPKDVQGL